LKLQLLVAALLFALALAPSAAVGATGSITFTSPAPGVSLSGTQSYTISGTITPTPSLPDNVFIEVEPQGSSSVLDASTQAVSATGSFSYTTNVGGNSLWVPGTYVITATDSNGATGMITIEYTSSGTTTTTATSAAASTTSLTTTISSSPSTTSSSLSGGIPEFPVQSMILLLTISVILVAYLEIRRKSSKPSRGTRLEIEADTFSRRN
jgi:hypothetical protein